MTPARVLVVDPVQDSREAIRSSLRDSGLVVSFAPDGASARIMLRAIENPVLVCGLDLNERDGRQLLLAAKASHPALRVIAVTAMPRGPNAEPFELARRLGADAAFTRPIPLQIFRETLEELARLTEA